MNKETAIAYLKNINIENLPDNAFSDKARNCAIIRMVVAGYSYSDCSKLFGISLERCRQIVLRAARFAKNEQEPFCLLPQRTINAVQRAGFMKPEDFANTRTSDIYKIRNLGEKGAYLLITFLGAHDIPLILDRLGDDFDG